MAVAMLGLLDFSCRSTNSDSLINPCTNNRAGDTVLDQRKELHLKTQRESIIAHSPRRKATVEFPTCLEIRQWDHRNIGWPMDLSVSNAELPILGVELSETELDR
jgi:hypothetical protein